MSNEGKPIQVEPAPEGPLVKAKRPMTEAQLEALKKGREKLAARRAAAKEAEENQSVQSAEPVKEKLDSYGLDKDKAESDSDSTTSSESEQDAQEEAQEHAYCSVM
jgi:hypothetical protein